MEEEIIYFYNVKDGKYYQSRYTHRWLNNLQQQCKKQKEVIDKAVKYIDDLRDESAERQGFYNCFPDDLFIPDINELLDILKEVSGLNH